MYFIMYTLYLTVFLAVVIVTVMSDCFATPWTVACLFPKLEDPLEKGMATHSSILAWRIPMDRGVWWATVHGVTNSRT